MSESMTTSYKPYYPPKPPGHHKDQTEIKIGDAVVEEGGVLKFAVTFDAPAEKPFVIKYTTSDITAKAPGDYTATTGQIYVKKGDTGAEIKVKTTEDYKYEYTETMKVTLSENSPWAKIVDGVGIGTIKDDDYKPQHYKLNVGDAYAKEGEYLYFKVSLDGKADHKVDFKWTTKDITTEGSADYTPTYGSGTIEKGADHAVIKILAKSDYLKEGYENFKVHVTENDYYVKVHDGEGLGTIKDVYYKPELPTVKIWGDEGYEGDKLVFKVAVDGKNEHGTKVFYHTEAKTANAYGAHQDDYVPGGGKDYVWIPAGKNEAKIEVQTKEDYKHEATEYFHVVLDHGDYKKGVDYAKGTIFDDDHATVPTFVPQGDAVLV